VAAVAMVHLIVMLQKLDFNQEAVVEDQKLETLAQVVLAVSM
jgi:hypothetical protein